LINEMALVKSGDTAEYKTTRSMRPSAHKGDLLLLNISDIPPGASVTLDTFKRHESHTALMALQLQSGLVLLGATNRSGRTISESLNDLHIDLIRLAPKNVNVRLALMINQARYSVYIRNLPAFMVALEGTELVSALEIYHPITVPDDQLIPFHLPDLIISCSSKLSDDLKEELEREIGQTSIREIVKDKKVLNIIKIAQYSNLRVVSSKGPAKTTPAFTETANIASYKWFLVAHKIASRFLSLHRYPAFQDEEHLKQYEAWHTKGKDDDEGEDDQMQGTEEADNGEYESSGSKGKGAPELKIVQNHYPAVEFGNRSHEVIKPQSPSSQMFITSPSEVPANPGIYVPYISDLAHYDTETVPAVISEYFAGCLGEDEREVLEHLGSLKAAWGILGETAPGKMMTHLFFCIRLGLKTQTHVLPYIHHSAGYQGCFLLGVGYVLEVEGRMRIPVSAEKLRAAFDSTDFHHKSLEGIYASLGNSKEWIDGHRSQVNSLMTLRNVVQEGWTHVRNQDAIVRHAKLLRFQSQYWKVTPSHILRALSLLNTSDPFPDDLPIMPEAIVETDRATVIWSCFGPFAPTFKVPGGRTVPLSTGVAKGVVTTKGKERAEDKLLTRIGVRTVPFRDAIADLKWVKEEKSIMTPFFQTKEKASDEHYTRFFGGDDLPLIMTALRTYTAVLEDVVVLPPKRKGGDSGEGPSKKKRGAVEDF